MSNINKQALREAAEKATPGRVGDRIDGSGSIKYECHGYDGSLVLRTDHKNMEYGFIGDNSNADELFFRLCVPDVILALLASLEAAEKRIAELEARAFNPAILDVIAERQRQQSVEGWMPEHDDEHCNGELAMAAVCYINETGTVNRNGGKPWGWPWDASWWKPNARRRNLVKAGALILAEIERIDRAAGIGKGE
ncbi:ead/Ea22-like family protein [Escherichia coli]|uniref:ead/Ea22-like family protein n=1 Tax=Escherichia coli TaxID=562 RepID=UPI00321AD6CC